MIREDFMKFRKIVSDFDEALDFVEEEVIGCGRYMKRQDRYCGHRYNWKNPDEIKMELWLCKLCENRK